MKGRLNILFVAIFLISMASCGAKGTQQLSSDMKLLAQEENPVGNDVSTGSSIINFDSDSAYQYLARQVDFGPRVPNTEAHRFTGDWLVGELKRHGAKVVEQEMQLKAFDGTILNSRNIYGQINPESKERILLLAHWDSRPWADKDPDPKKRTMGVEGANDGASGVAVLLEIARQLSLNPIKKGVDILFVDAEDWGTEGDDDSWALGTQYFVENPPAGYVAPQGAILLDMVGGKGAIFCREYFSERSHPRLADEIWQTAHRLGYGEMFPNQMGSAIMDDHVQLIKAGIPAIDIIEYHPEGEGGFNSRWHTASDNLEGISKETLGAVGQTLVAFLRK